MTLKESDFCARCLKSEKLCLCSELPTLPSQVHVLILQHPQEPDKKLGSARLAHLALPNSTLRIGLSWPNLTKALRNPELQVSAARWAVLYLGSGIKDQAPDGAKSPGPKKDRLVMVNRQGEPLPNQREALDSLEGLVVLDGSWSQAKALWWRNPWLLKLKRVILVPANKSLYRELRKEPRRECLSTIESIAVALKALGETDATSTGLTCLFEKLLKRYREKT